MKNKYENTRKFLLCFREPQMVIAILDCADLTMNFRLECKQFTTSQALQVLSHRLATFYGHPNYRNDLRSHWEGWIVSRSIKVEKDLRVWSVAIRMIYDNNFWEFFMMHILIIFKVAWYCVHGTLESLAICVFRAEMPSYNSISLMEMF